MKENELKLERNYGEYLDRYIKKENELRMKNTWRIYWTIKKEKCEWKIHGEYIEI